MDKLTILKSVFVFSGLEENLQAKISQHLKEAKFGAGNEIFAQGQQADSFYIVDSGEVAISKKLGDNHEKMLAMLGPGSVFGEMAFFSDSPRTANAAAKTDAVLWKIERGDFMKFISDEPEAGLRILSGLLQVTMDRLEHTSRELATIYETGKIISGGLKLSSIIKSILDEILLAVPEAKDGAIYLYNEFNEEYDATAAPQGAKEISIKSPIARLAKEKPGGIVINNAESVKVLNEGIFLGAHSLLVSPIIKEGKTLGFILLWNAKAPSIFRSSHLLLVSTVSSQLAEAIENIRHQQEERDRQRLDEAKQSY